MKLRLSLLVLVLTTIGCSLATPVVDTVSETPAIEATAEVPADTPSEMALPSVTPNPDPGIDEVPVPLDPEENITLEFYFFSEDLSADPTWFSSYDAGNPDTFDVMITVNFIVDGEVVHAEGLDMHLASFIAYDDVVRVYAGQDDFS